eukprot:TRINITY_DN5548_c0_g1_i2.p1 TRINITY_DN5548_c0_g1~~TRINITY_DN5548_c0_g1_i2.p1  ORF type:complete len:340 (+),score=87.74 TRINITY_DN5548_c0_g1_i2:76-1095(+)
MASDLPLAEAGGDWLRSGDASARLTAYSKAREAGLCVACSLMCAGCRAVDLLAQAVTPAGESTCAMCLDTLKNVGEAVDTICEVLDRAGYLDMKQVTLDVTIPRCIAVRAAMWVHHIGGAEQGEPVGFRTLPDARGILTSALAAAVRERGVTIELQNPDVTLVVDYMHSEADADLAPLWRRLGYKEAKNYSKWSKGKAVAVDPCWPPTRMVEEHLAAMKDVADLGTPFPPPAAPAALQTAHRRIPLLIAGRYLKYDREMPQSPWLINGKRMGRSSVHEELAKPMLPVIFPNGMGRNSALPKKARYDEADALVAAIGNIKVPAVGCTDLTGVADDGSSAP